MRQKQAVCEPLEQEEEKQMVNVKLASLLAGGSENLYKLTGIHSHSEIITSVLHK